MLKEFFLVGSLGFNFVSGSFCHVKQGWWGQSRESTISAVINKPSLDSWLSVLWAESMGDGCHSKQMENQVGSQVDYKINWNYPFFSCHWKPDETYTWVLVQRTLGPFLFHPLSCPPSLPFPHGGVSSNEPGVQDTGYL